MHCLFACRPIQCNLLEADRLFRMYWRDVSERLCRCNWLASDNTTIYAKEWASPYPLPKPSQHSRTGFTNPQIRIMAVPRGRRIMSNWIHLEHQSHLQANRLDFPAIRRCRDSMHSFRSIQQSKIRCNSWVVCGPAHYSIFLDSKFRLGFYLCLSHAFSFHDIKAGSELISIV